MLARSDEKLRSSALAIATRIKSKSGALIPIFEARIRGLMRGLKGPGDQK
jgi:hypothetical protein